MVAAILFAIIVLCGCLSAQTTPPERKVENGEITSERDPKVQIHLPKSVQYVGADPQKHVQRLYWVQFESYLPTRPELKHTYDSPRHASLGGMDFYVDTWVRRNDAETRPGSDREHIDALIGAKGYHMPEGMMYVRLVHLLDEQKRKELMIIYGEDVAQS